MSKSLDRWWDSLNKESEEIRIQINKACTSLRVKLLKAILGTYVFGFLLIAIQAFPQTVWITNTIAPLWGLLVMFLMGILVGTFVFEALVDATFRDKARENKKANPSKREDNINED